MSTQQPENDMHDLLGAYALDALDADDRQRVDAYLDLSAAARAEVDELRETAAMLALSPAPTETAPPHIWERIAHNIGEPQQHQPQGQAQVVDLASRRSVPLRFAAPAAAAAAIIVALLAYQVVDLRGQTDAPAVPNAAQFERALTVPGARETALDGNSTSLARVVLLPDGAGYLMNDDLAPLEANETYQLWALVGDTKNPTAISAGVLGADPRIAAFKISAPVIGFAVTKEQAGGSVTPTNDPVAVGTLKA